MGKEKTVTANEFVNVKDIKDTFLYTKDNYVLCYLRIYYFNLDLLAKEDQRNLTKRLAAEFDGDRKDFAYCTLPRELDLDKYKNFLKQKRIEETESLGKKHIIDAMLKKATGLSSDHENYEHMHYYKMWKQINEYVSKPVAEAELKERIMRLRNIYLSASIPCEIFSEREIIKLCNLYSNIMSGGFEVPGNLLLPDIPLLR